MTGTLAELFGQLPDLLGWHLLLSLSSLLLSLLISLPLGIAAASRPALAEWILGIAGVVQTVPTLALLALMVPLLGGAIGFKPAFLALTLYGILPIVAATVTGIRGVDPALVEAARGLGMNRRQMLRRVQLPLAAPVILSGIRTATVQAVGTATLGTPVGCTGLGNYIFQGLETRNQLAIVFGCVFAALLAIAMDQLVHLFELAATRRSRRLALVAAGCLAAICAIAAWAPLTKALAARSDTVIIGSGPFTEQHVLSDVLAERARLAGFAVEQCKGMGETIQFEALRRGQIDACVDYSGSIWALVMKRTGTASRAATIAEATRFLKETHGIVCLGSLGFENAYALATRRQLATQLGIRTIADLAPHSGRLKIGGDHQFFGRPEWSGVRKEYGLSFSEQVAMDPTLMYSAAAKGTVDVITAYATDGRILAFDLQLLDDPKQVLPPYDAVLLLSARAAQRPGLVEALRPLVGAITPEAMRAANKSVDVDQESPASAARRIAAALGAR